MNLQLNSCYSYHTERGHASSRKCIDGKITGENKCCGYCEYHGHPGFLTAQHITEHRCREKDCYYFQTKDNKTRKMLLGKKDNTKHLDKLVRTHLQDLEGLRPIRIKEDRGTYICSVVSIANYDLEDLANSFFEEQNIKITFKNVPCDFDRATEIVFGKDWLW